MKFSTPTPAWMIIPASPTSMPKPGHSATTPFGSNVALRGMNFQS